MKKSEENHQLFGHFGVIYFLDPYLLATNTPNFLDKVIGFLTPIGGLLLILAWGVLFTTF
jgi:uncharacterized membrane protein YgdD (TMEM256/DUF423 family)